MLKFIALAATTVFLHLWVSSFAPSQLFAALEEEAEDPITVVDVQEIIRLNLHARELVRQLGDDKYALRDQAEQELQKIAMIVRGEIEKAAQSDDPEIASRARAILASIPEPDYTILDGLGGPIPFATIHIQMTYRVRKLYPVGDPLEAGAEETEIEKQSELELLSDGAGRIAIGKFENGVGIARLDHSDYGKGLVRFHLKTRGGQLTFPLIRKSSDAFQRAMQGMITNSAGKPLVGAEVTCRSIRTPGEGLINVDPQQGVALTNDDGSFAYYPSIRASDERGETIPPNSNYQLIASLPDSDSVVPVGGIFNNSQPALIKLATESMLHRFQFESVDGTDPDEQQLLREFSIALRSRMNGKVVVTPIDIKAATTGIRLSPGEYDATRSFGKKKIDYVPLQVDESSHEVLTFKLPEPITYRGRLIHGQTDEPIRDGFVIGYRSSSGGSLAQLTENDWKVLKSVKSNEDPNSQKLKRLNEFHGLQGIVRTRADGTFTITQPFDRDFYGLIAFDQGMIPFALSGYYLKDRKTGETIEHDYPMFPAAKLIVQPMLEKRPGAYSRWMFAEDGQPDWIQGLRDAEKKTRGEFKYRGWLELNEKQPVFVPAGISLRVRFSGIDSSGFAPYILPEPVRLEAGESKDIGEIHFTPTLPAVVRVVDKEGNPIEAIPVRRFQDEIRTWTVAHNTDANGEARFGLHPNSTGKFRACESRGAERVEQVVIQFSVKEEPPTEPFRIELSDETINRILNR